MKLRSKVRFWNISYQLGEEADGMNKPEYVSKYATKDAADEAGDDSESEDEMSSVGSFESGDEEPAGQMEV